MRYEYPPYFVAHCGGYVYRAYVGAADLLLARVGKIPTANAVAYGGGMVGALAAHNQMQRDMKEVDGESADLDRCNVDGVRAYIRTHAGGFTARPKDLDEIRLDLVGEWKAWFFGFFGKPDPAFILRHRSEGEWTFLFPKKKDVVIALYELGRLFGDQLEVGLPQEEYRKALKKYEKGR
jgi:hypothetical protein